MVSVRQAAWREGSFQATLCTQRWAPTDVTSTSSSEISTASWLGLNLY